MMLGRRRRPTQRGSGRADRRGSRTGEGEGGCGAVDWRLRRDHRVVGDAPVPVRPMRPRVELAAYWLLYVVAFGAAVLHFRAGNGALALLCAGAVVISIRDIARFHRAARRAP